MEVADAVNLGAIKANMKRRRKHRVPTLEVDKQRTSPSTTAEPQVEGQEEQEEERACERFDE